MKSFFDYSRRELGDILSHKTRATRLYKAVYQGEPLSANDGRLLEGFKVSLLVVANRFVSSDGTRRYLFRLEDHEQVESVTIPEDRRFTFCVSSQIGCALACRFCLTGQLGLTRNLSVGEIVSQVVAQLADLGEGVLHKKSENAAANSPPESGGAAKPEGRAGVVPLTNCYGFAKEPPRLLGLKRPRSLPLLTQEGSFRPRCSVVFMGMGEPLQNYENVMRSIEILTDDHGLAIPLNRITLSTAGLVPAIQNLSREKLFPNLSISLTGATNSKRDDLMPINRKYPIEEVIQAVRDLPASRRRRVMFEYVMLKNVTDDLGDAQHLSALLKGLSAKVNLIPLNESPDLPFERSGRSDILRFQQVLLQNGITTFIRKTRGDDVSGACGQLKQFPTRI